MKMHRIKMYAAEDGSYGGANAAEIGVYQTKANKINADLPALLAKLDRAINAEGIQAMVDQVKEKWESPVAVEFFNGGGQFFSSGVKTSVDKLSQELVKSLTSTMDSVNSYCTQRAANQGIAFDRIETESIKITDVDISAIKKNKGDNEKDVHMDIGTGQIIKDCTDTMITKVSGIMDELESLFANNIILTGNDDWNLITTALRNFDDSFRNAMSELNNSISQASEQYEGKLQSN